MKNALEYINDFKKYEQIHQQAKTLTKKVPVEAGTFLLVYH
jgi:hypothetical protein